jgi:Rrf2 family protein
VIRAALSLARVAGTGDYRKAREIAKEMNLPVRYTPQLMGLLAIAGLAEAKAGQSGGYRLTRPPEEITLLEVVEAGEGPVKPRKCALRNAPCRGDAGCAFHDAWEDAWKAWSDALEAKTLASMLDVDEKHSRRGHVQGDRESAAR